MIYIKSSAEIQKMRDAGKLAAEVLHETGARVREGISTESLNDFAHRYTISKGAISAPLNYKGFPKSICTSVNNVICHGIPCKEEILKNGDILNIDVTVKYKGYHGDTSRMFRIGKISQEAEQLIEDTEKAMWKGIQAILPGNKISDIGDSIETFLKAKNYGVVRDFTGHGIGSYFHEDPPIPHYSQRMIQEKMRPGMIFTVEPMVNLGDWRSVVSKEDQWTATTVDGSLSAQFEHTCLVSKNGYEVLTIYS